jgi:cytochrome c oxidase assembly factor 3
MRNALTGIGLGLFAFGVYSYSISAVKQDVFDDIDEEAKALARTGTPSGTAALPIANSSSASATTPDTHPPTLSKDEEQKIMESAFDAATRNSQQREDEGAVAPASSVSSPKGVLQHLDSRFPNLLDPKSKTWVWGAPPIDNIGKMSPK